MDVQGSVIGLSVGLELSSGQVHCHVQKIYSFQVRLYCYSEPKISEKLYDVFPEPVSLMSRYLPYHSQSIVTVQTKVAGLKFSRQHGQGIGSHKFAHLRPIETAHWYVEQPGAGLNPFLPLAKEHGLPGVRDDFSIFFRYFSVLAGNVRKWVGGVNACSD